MKDIMFIEADSFPIFPESSAAHMCDYWFTPSDPLDIVDPSNPEAPLYRNLSPDTELLFDSPHQTTSFELVEAVPFSALNKSPSTLFDGKTFHVPWPLQEYESIPKKMRRNINPELLHEIPAKLCIVFDNLRGRKNGAMVIASNEKFNNVFSFRSLPGSEPQSWLNARQKFRCYVETCKAFAQVIYDQNGEPYRFRSELHLCQPKLLSTMSSMIQKIVNIRTFRNFN